MSLIEFQRYFIVVLVSKLVSLHKKTGKKWYEKNANHTISIYENCMTSIFLMATTKIFRSIFEIVPKNFLFFFQPQIDFRIQTNIF